MNPMDPEQRNEAQKRMAAEQLRVSVTPQTLVDRRIDESLEDYRKGQVSGPYNSAADLVQSLHQRRPTAAQKPKQTKKRSE